MAQYAFYRRNSDDSKPVNLDVVDDEVWTFWVEVDPDNALKQCPTKPSESEYYKNHYTTPTMYFIEVGFAVLMSYGGSVVEMDKFNKLLAKHDPDGEENQALVKVWRWIIENYEFHGWR